MAQPMTFATRAAAALALGVLIGHARPAQAQDSGASMFRILELGVHYGAPERLSGTVSGVFPFGGLSRKYQDPTKGMEIRGRIGRDGVGVGIGPRWLWYGPWGPGAMVTVTRTFSSPLGANGQGTYVGLEVGCVWLYQLSLGVARQVDGRSDRRDTVVTWSVGAQIPYGFWRW